MVKNFNNLFLSFLSISWMLLISLLDNLGSVFEENVFRNGVLIFVGFILAQVLITKIELKYILPKYQVDNLIGAKEIENLDGEFLPTYLGYFFVALGLDNVYVALLLFTIVATMISVTRVQYYNPLFLFFHYHFYKIRTEDGVVVFLISKKEIRINEKQDFDELRRISNFVYFDMEES